MKKSKMLVAGNWKMAPTTLSEAKNTFSLIKRAASKFQHVQTVVCPPFLYIDRLTDKVSGHRVVVGAQDLYWENEGAHTGEVSPTQLYDAGADYVIIGHSERRAMGETDEEVNKKIIAALKAGLHVILCVGEDERDEDGDYMRRITDQVRIALSGISRASLADITIAYEPVWAIGRDALRPASPEDVVEITILIRKVLADMYSNGHRVGVSILYGGSVDDRNAEDFLKTDVVQGFLVGRASLSAPIFSRILETVNTFARDASKKSKK